MRGAGSFTARLVPELRFGAAGGAWAVQGLRALGWFADAGWQDLRAVRDSRGPCSEKGPFLARSSRGVSSDGGLRGFSDAWRANLATNWRFSRPRPLSGCMERKTCHGLPPGNESGRNLAIARRPGMHFTGILPSVSARNAAAHDTMRHDTMRHSAITPCAVTSRHHAPRCHAPYAALLSPLKK